MIFIILALKQATVQPNLNNSILLYASYGHSQQGHTHGTKTPCWRARDVLEDDKHRKLGF